MSELFISTEELQGLVTHTGLGVGYLMMRLIHSPTSILILARELTNMVLDKYGKATVDVPLQVCRHTHIHITDAGFHSQIPSPSHSPLHIYIYTHIRIHTV
jgi:hypothetical protein